MIEITQEEMNLYSEKWFDYRPYTPEACNLLFLKEWLIAREKMLLRTKLDVRFNANDNVAYRKQFFFSSIAELQRDETLWNCLVMLRKFADRKGMPYDLFWQFGYRVLQHDSIHENEPIYLTRTVCLGSITDLFEELQS